MGALEAHTPNRSIAIYIFVNRKCRMTFLQFMDIVFLRLLVNVFVYEGMISKLEWNVVLLGNVVFLLLAEFYSWYFFRCLHP